MRIAFNLTPEQTAFRACLITSSVWAKLFPPITETELTHAVAHMKPTTTVSMALQDCLRRRDLAARGRLRSLDRAEAAENDLL